MKTNLIASETDMAYTPEEVPIDAEHRYEGMGNPSDPSSFMCRKPKMVPRELY